MKKSLKLLSNLLLIPLIIVLTSCAGMAPKVHIPETPPKAKQIKNVEIALVLGSGGSKGAAHLGVLDVLEKNGIKPDLIVGCSAGSIVGAFYADHPNIEDLKFELLDLKKDDILDFSISATFQSMFRNKAPIQGYKLERLLLKHLNAYNFDELKIPFIAVTTSLTTNKLYEIKSGPVPRAVVASSSLPPVFQPVHIYNHSLVDGAVISPVPVYVAKKYKPKMIIAVDISSPPFDGPVNNIFELTYRVNHISYYELSRKEAKSADVLIHPNMARFGTFEDHRVLEMYNEGLIAAKKALPSIKREMLKRKINVS